MSVLSSHSDPLQYLFKIFASEAHTIVLLEWHAIRWMAASCLHYDDLDLLVRPSSMSAIVSCATASSLWATIQVTDSSLCTRDDLAAVTRITASDSRTVTLWPETAYEDLHVDDPLIELPGLIARNDVLVESSLEPPATVPHRVRLASHQEAHFNVLHPLLEVKAYVPTVASMAEALWKRSTKAVRPDKSQYSQWLGPGYLMSLLIRYLFLEIEEQRLKLQGSFKDKRVWDTFNDRLDRYVRMNKSTGVMTRGGKPWSRKASRKLRAERRANRLLSESVEHE